MENKRSRGLRARSPGESRPHASIAAVPAITGWRLWLFRGVVVVGVPILLLVCLEAGLRLAGVGFDPSVTIACRVQGVPCLADNPRYSWQFFPPAIARQFEPFAFPVTKPARTYRVVVLGESATQGIPDGSYAFARIAREMLRAAYPDVQFEVINAGMTAINSHVIYQIGSDLLRHDPDLLVVYMGNNEVVGPFGPGTVFAPFSRHLSLIRLGISLRKTRLGQCVSRLSQQSQQRLLRSWGGMEMFLDKQIRLGDPGLEVVYRHLRDNLTDLCTAATRAGTGVIVCTVASNLRDCPPFASLHRAGLGPEDLQTWEALCRQGSELESAGQYQQAIEPYRQAQAIDDQFAALHFRLAVCLDRTGQVDEARSHYLLARELDTLRFRTDNHVNDIIRQTAAALGPQGVRLVDVEETFARHSDRQIPGDNLFYEHVHMNFAGNYLLARTLVESIGPQVAARFGQPKEGPVEVLSEEDCRTRLAYTDTDRYLLAKKVVDGFLVKPPFTGQLYHDRSLEQWRQELGRLKTFLSKQELARSAEAYERAIALNPSDWNLYWKLGTMRTDCMADHGGAEKDFRRVQDLAPTFNLAYTGMGQVYLRLDRYAEAARQFEKSVGLYDAHAMTHYLLGFAYEKQRDLARAARGYNLAVYWQPDEARYYSSLAKVLRQQDRLEEAIRTCRKGTLYCPTDAFIHGNLGLFLAEVGKTAEARMEVRKALELDPNSEQVRRAAERVLGAFK